MTPPDDEPPDRPSRDTLVDAKKTKLGVSGVHERPTDDLVGQVVSGYLVEERLGKGAMGAVYRASHIDTNRTVAIKALHTHLVDEKTIVHRFRREAKLAARLGHPHIGGVIELATTAEGQHLMVLEFVEGEPLANITTMPLPPDRVFTLVGQLLRGLEHAHAHGLVHRDLKPENVLVEWRNGRDHARIIDFGIAILREPTGDGDSNDRLTATGQMIGTPLYMSPEQARGEVVDHRSDLYSLGVMTYEMFTGVLPFEGRALDILAASLKKDPPPMGVRVKGLIVDPLHEAFARKLMNRDANKRFGSARHALDVLKLIETDPGSAGPALGIMDLEKALAVISLPPPPATKAKSKK